MIQEKKIRRKFVWCQNVCGSKNKIILIWCSIASESEKIVSLFEPLNKVTGLTRSQPKN